jgi:hypothetical protein
MKKSRHHLHFMSGEHDPGSFRAQSKSAEEPAKPGREVNLQLLASTQRFLQGSLLAASMPDARLRLPSEYRLGSKVPLASR